MVSSFLELVLSVRTYRSGLGCQDEDPRVPRGREVVVITNVTVQSGSFGVEEDEIYYKASVLRERKLQSVHCLQRRSTYRSCRRIEVKINIKFNDPRNPGKVSNTCIYPTKTTKQFPKNLSS
jgi:acetyl-CoA carboxylase/biotin carboxylase 1